MCAAALEESGRVRAELESAIGTLTSQREQLMAVIDDLSVQLASAGNTSTDASEDATADAAAAQEQLQAVAAELAGVRSDVDALQAALSEAKAQVAEKDAALQEACQVSLQLCAV